MYVLLYGLWLILCGSLSPEKALAGLAAVALIALLAWPLFGYTVKDEWRFLRRLPFLAAYAVLVVVEVVKANFTMMACILKPSLPLEPSLVRLDTGLTTRLGRFLLANCITLTPGTITVKLEGGRLIIHAMRPDMLDGISDSAVVRVLKRMEAIQ